MRSYPMNYGCNQNSHSTIALLKWIKEQHGGKELLAAMDDPQVELKGEAYALLSDLRRMGLSVAEKLARR